MTAADLILGILLAGFILWCAAKAYSLGGEK